MSGELEIRRHQQATIANPQTWVRLRHLKLRRLANMIGNQAMAVMDAWPRSGEGRAIKLTTEGITRRLRDGPLNQTLERSLTELMDTIEDLRTIRTNPFFISRLTNTMMIEEGEIRPLGELINEAVSEVVTSVAIYRAAQPLPPTLLEEAQSLTPEQKIGPVKFEVADGVLRVQHQASLAPEADVRNTEAALRELLAAGEQLATALTSSNMDRRLIESVVDIRARLASKQDIIQLGIAAIFCQTMWAGFTEELSTVDAARLKAYSVSVGMYVAQYPEWVRFSENAAAAEYSSEDVASLHQAGIKLVERLRSVERGVDPEVPRSLAFVLETIRDPRRAVKRTMFASIRAIENLVSVVFRSFTTALSGVPEGAKDGMKSAAKSVVHVAVLSAAAYAAIAVSPAASRVLQTNWLEEAGKLIQESLKAGG